VRDFFSRIWTAKASTFAGIVGAGLAALGAGWANAPEFVRIGVPVGIAMLGAFSKGSGAQGRQP